MAQWDRILERQLEKDTEKFSALTETLEKDLDYLNSLESSMLKEIEKARRQTEGLINKLKKICSECANHHEVLLERNRVWRNNELKRIKQELSSVEVETEQEAEAKVFYGIDAVMRLVTSISLSDEVRARDFEAQCYSFLLDSVLDRALRGESQGYFLSEEVDIGELVQEGVKLLELLRETSSLSLLDEDVWASTLETNQDWWYEYALPKIYGGSDPDWYNIDALDVSFMQKWVQDSSVHPVYNDCLDLIRREKYGQ